LTKLSSSEVVIIGAGPYGLASAAHLRAAGLRPHVFGEVMGFWQRQMPVGMILRSPWRASFIADPEHCLTLDDYEREFGLHLPRQVPLADFVNYGRWFQQQAVPDVDERRVILMEQVNGGYDLQLSDNSVLHAAQVVVAAGIAPFARRPRLFDGLPVELVTHSEEHRDLDEFAGRSVVVVGGGQSAFESAALLGECGARVELIMRKPVINWLNRSSRLHHQPWLRDVFYAPSDIGPAGLSQLVDRPDLWRKMPRSWQGPLAQRAIRPAASSWLKPRMQGVTVTTGRDIVDATVDDRTLGAAGGIRLRLDDGSSRGADHVLLATGYQVDVTGYPFLSPRLLAGLQTVDGYPVLGEGFESASLPGLHFMGAPAAWSFGPLMRFVAGTRYAAPALARHIASPAAGTRSLDRP
jgi:FAD-dependent urate hydroxylase